ncbi:MAG: hypothetical protein A3G52_00105 [Candidatus Taylorbacteria bacterium RIFCSPLOWO2_12_FULL_43_20]|uniref:DUF5678 domain-containing protein n=1 Tax=Candidatus Taylorbacteria bacterium RIFCSPLOWO2_12_FULL_43_20 TaxID=1802332 RepID=A0A1G2P2N3_9BACT|nr:MAG: hypothetical protein A2825_03160 [Candidatus Taylorbacteria bacterium RIFCSPHIGHO2_01_FULL_43_120]OHA22963.1 MAG: hypothetical protein A3B98_02895 [Candidatus Taylorbacteria bacterium RIFCSPHIGHO2_02_FULL_43_55]OHA31949.1 MAG: hypothetical protein A3B09_01015 [Candidatus Taylorbacteria bacterium RIFCSPLOWO2_01_FULL_43_83]OHA37972.1 MAG: hypothetical protein A3H58_01430 [Candidatus Taylorbacteria bacterium RIFCSPLOWO2_02_FULL_43_22b]OHA42605.1 MAG: hypothetical protein A3G52_00105 [Candi
MVLWIEKCIIKNMTKDWTKLYKKHKGQWVALLNDENTVVSSGKTAKEAAGKAKDKGFHHVFLTRIPDELLSFVGFSR